ncbi:hypothetical protein CU098_001571, partial [Rhizopus stolonifer]
MSKGATESFVVFGTAFPEQTEKDRRAGRSDAGQFVPVWKQEARDEQGRRRFHGAFTGGFSAGYFNTVGSKEGWEPSNYVSSRSARNEMKEARPEDYMDEEDLQDLAGARKLVATEEFDILGGTERELSARRQLMKEDEGRGGGLEFLGSSLISMFGPPKDSVGVRLLRKMGWRPGQGIGPRMKRRQLEASDDDEDEDVPGDVTFAPRDTPIENYQVKRDTYGLGYDLSTYVPEVAEMKRLRELAAAKKGENTNRSMFGVYDPSAKSKEVFGLGAFEEAEDDDDVYRNDTSFSNYHTALYDDEEGYTRDQLKSITQKRQTESKPINHLKCSDGRPPLTGFHLSEKTKDSIGKWYPPPQVPATFTGIHAPINNETLPPSSLVNKESVFSFEERGHILGEQPIEKRSVFDYMPQHSKDKLNQAISFFVDSGKDKSQLSDFPSVPKDVAHLALKGFMPFGDNPQKQARYRHYLENQAGKLTQDGIPLTVLPIPEGLTYESGMKEMDEFAKAARIFRPISAMMSGRFTSASSETKHVETLKFEGGLKTEEEYRKEKEQMAKLEAKPEKKQLSQEAEAAAMKMFGALTRTIKPFYPNRLVCKRFNVRNPHPDHDQKTDADAGRTQAGSKDALSKDAMETMLNERIPLKFTSNYERPSMDIFKAIFDNSDSEEEEEAKPEERSPVEKSPDMDLDFIGPPLPPAPPTADIPIITNTPEPTESFRPMFK